MVKLKQSSISFALKTQGVNGWTIKANNEREPGQTFKQKCLVTNERQYLSETKDGLNAGEKVV